jgi:hypothetical protein
MVQPSLQGVAAGLELVELLAEAELFLAVAAPVQVVQDSSAAAVDGLPAQAVLLSEPGDGSVVSEQDGGSAADAVEKG